MDARAIIRKYTNRRLSTHASTYVGRGNTTSDLNSALLEQIYGGIKVEIGEPAARSFVNMVASLGDNLSASRFLESLYDLESNDWTMRKAGQLSELDVLAKVTLDARQTEDADTADHIGISSIFNTVFARSRESHTSGDDIAGAFLRRHMDKIDNMSHDRRTALVNPYSI